MEVIAVRADMPRGWDDPACGANDGGFARAVGTNERKHFTTFYVKGNIVQDLMSMIGGGEILNFEHMCLPFFVSTCLFLFSWESRPP